MKYVTVSIEWKSYVLTKVSLSDTLVAKIHGRSPVGGTTKKLSDANKHTLLAPDSTKRSKETRKEWGFFYDCKTFH